MSAAPQKTKAGAVKIPAIVDAIVPINELVTRFEFRRADGTEFPTFSAGAHTVVEILDGEKRRLNPYSLMSDPADTARYAISVRRDDEGRGGSLYLHQKLKVGDAINLTYPVNLFSLDLRAKKHLFLAGGIGITPFMSMIKQLSRDHGNWELHYATRTKALATYGDELSQGYPDFVYHYHDDLGQTFDLDTLFKGQPLGTHLYVCGPSGMINWVKSTAQSYGWPRKNIHSEEFLAPKPGQAFHVRLCKSNKIIEVGENESLLEALEREGVEAPFSCRGGVCGQCETNVTKYDGEFVHRDHWLEPEEHASGEKIMLCVSRFIGQTLEIDR